MALYDLFKQTLLIDCGSPDDPEEQDRMFSERLDNMSNEEFLQRLSDALEARLAS